MSYLDSTLLLIGKVPQYFIDNVVIEQTQDLTRTVHRPQKEAGPLITKDRPWEHTPYLTVNGCSVVRDSVSGEFKCWYDDWPVDPKRVIQEGVYCVPSWTMYARSSDGRTWEKPALDYLAIDGRKTNIVIGGKPSLTKLDTTTVFEDPLERDPGKRFKMFLTRYVYAKDRQDEGLAGREGRDGLTDEVRVEMHYSEDGIRWTAFKELPQYGQHGNNLGDAYTFFTDTDAGIYRFLTRAAGMQSVHHDERRPATSSFFPPIYPHDVARMNKRRVFLSESRDLFHWSRPLCILNPDAQDDNLDDSYYGMVQFKMGEVYLGLVNVLHEVANTIDVRLAYSRDGWHWDFLNQRQPWLATSAEAWDSSMVSVSSPPIAVGDELFVFHGGARNHHDWWITGLREGLDVPEARSLEEVHYGMGLARMRRDGFVSLDAGAVREGILITRVLRTEGRQLVLNAVCGKGGSIRVEVTDAEERVLDGCTRDQCDVFCGDSTQATVTWNGRPAIPHSGAVRFRFFMRNASLYSLTCT